MSFNKKVQHLALTIRKFGHVQSGPCSSDVSFDYRFGFLREPLKFGEQRFYRNRANNVIQRPRLDACNDTAGINFDAKSNDREPETVLGKGLADHRCSKLARLMDKQNSFAGAVIDQFTGVVVNFGMMPRRKYNSCHCRPLLGFFGNDVNCMPRGEP